MSERIDLRPRRVALYGAVGIVGGFVGLLGGGFVLFALAEFSIVSVLSAVVLLAGPGIALWALVRNPDQRPASDALHAIPLVHLVSIPERLDRRIAVLAVAAGTIGQVALLSISPLVSLLALFGGLVTMWTLDPTVGTHRLERRSPLTEAGLPAGPAGTLASVFVLGLGGLFVLVGLALGWIAITSGLSTPVMKVRFVAGLGIGSVVMFVFGGLFVALGLGGDLSV